MGIVNLRVKTPVNTAADLTGPVKTGGLVGKVITDKMFGVNFLSSFEKADFTKGGMNYDDVVKALGNISVLGQTGSQSATPIASIRFPGGTLTEEFYARATTVLSVDTPVNHGRKTGISAAEFIEMAKGLGTDMTHVLPTWRYLDTKGLTQQDRAELYTYIKTLLEKAIKSGVNVNAFELGNEYWSKISFDGQKDVRMGAAEYGKIASEQAEVVQAAIDDFVTANRESILRNGNWVEPKILLQMGAQYDDINNIGHLKAQIDSQTILNAFSTPAQRAAIDGFVVHRYEHTIHHVGDPWVKVKPFHMHALPDMMTAKGWKSFDNMSVAVSEWNLDNRSQETGLRAFSTVVALMGEMAALGVEAADFWSLGARSQFPLARFEGGAYSPTATFLGLSFTGEAFRMMNESLRGKQSLILFEKSGGVLRSLNGNQMAQSSGDNLKTHVKAFSDGREVVLFVSNLTSATDLVNLDLSAMIGKQAFHAWASHIESASNNPMDNLAAPIINNMTLNMSGGVLRNFELGAYETIRITVTLGNNGAKILGYTENDSLTGSKFADMIDGRDGNDTLFGLHGNDTIFGGNGDDYLYGGDGRDVIYGGDGDDLIGGGLGDDFVFGGDGQDIAVFFGNARIRVDLAITVAQNTGMGLDVLSSIEGVWGGDNHDILLGNALNNILRGGGGNDSLDGRGGADSLDGNQGNDTLRGGAGADTLHGGVGSDVLFGGQGADIFVFAKGAGRDVIQDFQDGSDLIQLTGRSGGFETLRIGAVSGGTSVTYGNGDVITLIGLRPWQITQDDFIFG
jgi:Ca2+-binding RTX toxin-like protein